MIFYWCWFYYWFSFVFLSSLQVNSVHMWCIQCVCCGVCVVMLVINEKLTFINWMNLEILLRMFVGIHLLYIVYTHQIACISGCVEGLQGRGELICMAHFGIMETNISAANSNCGHSVQMECLMCLRILEWFWLCVMTFVNHNYDMLIIDFNLLSILVFLKNIKLCVLIYAII